MRTPEELKYNLQTADLSKVRTMRTPEELKRYLQTADLSEVCTPAFALYYGPMMATSVEMAATLEMLSNQCIYYLPFKYGGFFVKMIQKCSAAEIKSYLRDVTIDMDALRRYFISGGTITEDRDAIGVPTVDQFDLIAEGFKSLLLNAIQCVRVHQQKNGIMESAMTSYAPIVPYSNEMYKQWLETFWTRLGKKKRDPAVESILYSIDYKGGYSIIDKYKALLDGVNLFDIIGPYLMRDLVGVISDSATLYNDLRDMTDIADMVANEDEENKFRYQYYELVFLANQKDSISLEDLTNYLTARASITNVNKKTSNSEFNSAFEAMYRFIGNYCLEAFTQYAQEQIETALETDLNGKLFRDPNGNPFRYGELFDLNLLLDTFSKETHYECSQHVNEDFLEEMKLAITNYSFFMDEMLVAEIGSLFLAVPFEVLGDDCRHKVLYIDREGDLKVSDMDGFVKTYGVPNEDTVK